MLELVFIRHGQTAGNLRRNYVGRTDEPLCEEGRLALQQRKTAGVYPVAELLFCSPMLRCQQTAAIIYPQLQAQTVEELRECNFGDFENQNYQDLSNNLAYQRWLNSNGELSFPGGPNLPSAVAVALSRRWLSCWICHNRQPVRHLWCMAARLWLCLLLMLVVIIFL